MIINRHNYEEIFLLYVDNELDADERKAVEKFIGENADLAKELESFQQATLVETDTPFFDKEILYKNEGSISLNNYEEYFLLSVDDELSEKQSAELESFLSKNQQLKGEYDLLKKTKCEPEFVAFQGKEILYRKEKQRRIVPFRLSKISMAAAIAGLAIVTWLVYNSSPKQHLDGLAATKKPIDTMLVQHPTVAVPKNDVALSTKSEKKNVIKPAIFTIKENIALSKKPFKKIESSVATTKTKSNITEEKTGTNNTTIDQSSQAQQTIPQISAGKKSTESEPIVAEERDENPFLAKLANEKNTDEKSSVSHAVYRTIDTDNDEDKNFYIGNAEINKVKLKGFFKKAVSFIEKKIIKNQP